jgi:G3E family GTPase
MRAERQVQGVNVVRPVPVTLLTGFLGSGKIDDFHEAQEQIAMADRLLISKTDLVSRDEESRLLRRIAIINARAPIARAHFGETPTADILDIHAFDTNAALELEALAVDRMQRGHADRIGSFVFRTSHPFDAARLDAFLSAIIDLYGPDMLRCKGVLHLDGYPAQIIVQGVQTVLRVEQGAVWPADDARSSVLVFIGRDLPKELFQRELENCLRSPRRPGFARHRMRSGVIPERRHVCA